MRRKFDKIVDFAVVEQLIDTPFKFYSRGMRVRLAFAVAAHLEPEALLIDEVLSVGDVVFRRECTNRMRTVATNGAMVLAYSQPAQVITSLCDRAIRLDCGLIVMDGLAADTMSSYLAQGMGLTAARRWEPESAPGEDIARFLARRAAADNRNTGDEVESGQRFRIEAEVEALQSGCGMALKKELYSGDRTHGFSSLNSDNPMLRQKRYWKTGCYILLMWVLANLLQVCNCTVHVLLRAWEAKQKHQAYSPNTVDFHVTEKFYGSGARAGVDGNMTEVVRPLLEWVMQSSGQTTDLRVAALPEVLSASGR